MYAEHILQYKNSISAAKTSYYAKTIREGGRNTRTLFSIVNGLLKPPDNTMHQLLKSPVTTPNNDIPNDHCSAFLNFFDSKIANIHEQLASANIMQPELVAAITTTLTSSGALHGFSFPTEEYISELITKSNSSTCLLDPIPTSLVKVCLPVIITPITSIIKSSLTTGTVPSSLKVAMIRPTLKKPGLDCNDLNNYRPISNLPFISKILEKVVASQLQAYLQHHHLFEQFQSGFRPQHSTETALIKITNDLLCAADAGLLSILILLDLSAAFATIPHQLLLEQLMSIGVCGTAYKWFESYLSERTYFVQIQDQRSENSTLHRGVPQGSVLGPLLFIVYLLPLGNIFRHYGIQFHSYADDTQLYVSTSPTASLPPNGLTACLHDIQAWMTQNYLKLNSNKTEVLLIGTTTTLQKMTLLQCL